MRSQYDFNTPSTNRLAKSQNFGKIYIRDSKDQMKMQNGLDLDTNNSIVFEEDLPVTGSVYQAENTNNSIDSAGTKKQGNGDFEIDFDEFTPIIKSVLRSSNVIRRKNLNLIKTENEL